MTIEQKILANHENALLFKHLGVNPGSDSVAIINKSKKDAYKYHEALSNFWEDYCKMFPDSIKYLVADTGALVCPTTGKIFAFQFGQNDFAFRHDFSLSGLENKDELRVVRNLDGIIADIRDLREDWVIGLHFVGDDETELENSYQKNCN